MTTTHTPGPWVREDIYGVQHVFPSGDRPAIARAISEADARLIAEAPAMLAALRDAYQSRVFGPRRTSEVRAILARIDGEG